MNITIAISQLRPLDSGSLGSISMHESRQQYSAFFVKVAVPLQRNPDSQTCPDISWQVSFWTWKLS